MSEPLAATLLSGAVLAMLWAMPWRAVGARVLARAGAVGEAGPAPHPTLPRAVAGPGLLLGALALIRPEYLAISLPIAVVVFARRGRGELAPVPCAGGGHARRAGVGRGAVDGAQRGRAGPFRADLDRRRPGAVRRLLHAVGRRPGKGRRRGARAPPRTRSRSQRGPQPSCGWSRSSPRWPRSAIPGMETDAALARMGRERLWDDVSEQPLDYAGFLGAKSGASGRTGRAT